MANGGPLGRLYKPAAGAFKPPYLAFVVGWMYVVGRASDPNIIDDLTLFIPSFGFFIGPSYKQCRPNAMLFTVRLDAPSSAGNSL